MPLNTDLNVSPYFDDYDDAKSYHRVLFRPSVAVQARELTQSQSILQSQIEKFGNWAFNNGDIVQGCEINDLPRVAYLRLADLQANGSLYDVTAFVNCVANSTTSNLQARVILSSAGLVNTYPNTTIVYLNYLNSGTDHSAVFSNTEQVTFYKVSASGNTVLAVVNAYSNSSSNVSSTGNAHGISIGAGVIFINGNFVNVPNQTYGIVNAYGTNAGNNVVGFSVIETIVTENQDPSLNDNALGYPNENAPGAHRLKMTPTLVSLDPTTVASVNAFNAIATYNNNSLVHKVVQTDLHSVVGDAVATTVKDEAGNFVISPFSVDTVSKTSNANFMSARVSPGYGYASGYPINLLKTAYVDVRRGTDIAQALTQQITTSYGSYVQVQEVAGSFDFNNYQTVYLYDTVQQAVTNHYWGSKPSPAGTLIGSAQIRNFEYSTGLQGTNTAIYNAYLFNINLNTGYNFSQVLSLYSNSTAYHGFADITANGLQQGSAKQLFYSFGHNGLVTLKGIGASAGTNEYIYRAEQVGTLSHTDGTVAVTIGTSAAGGVDQLPYGIGQLSDALTNEIVVVPLANAQMSMSGTVTNYSGNGYILGSGTTFTSKFSVGEIIKVGSEQPKTIVSIASDTAMTVDSVAGGAGSGLSFTKFVPAGYYIPLKSTLVGSRRVYVSNTSSMTIYTGLTTTADISVMVYYNIQRTQAIAAKKVINKHRYVTIDTTSNPNGPWCLGVADIHRLRNVYGAASATYSTSGTQITSSFLIDSGMRDGQYGLGYLYLARGASVSSTPYLTVEVDYFTANTTNGLGFYTIDSYPIDDANTANNTAITTSHMPLYVTEYGNKINLRDYVDFRPVANNTANNTGTIADLSNTTQVATAITYATLNPSNTVVLQNPSGNSHIPSVGKNFQGDIQYYLPRKDLFFFAPNGSLKIKEGQPSMTPQSPLNPIDGMPVAVLNIPVYPSLTSDEMDSLLPINQQAYSLARDTLNPVLVQIVTNRRYSMADIGTLDKRITNLEYYVSLSQLEQKAAATTVTDANGNNRYKNGIFTDPFNSHALGDVSNQEYRISIDTAAAIARPFINRETIPTYYSASDSSSVQKTGRAITLPYVSNTLVSQPYATKYRNASAAVFKWNGHMDIYPTFSNHVDTVNTGSISATIDNASAWQQFAASPFGTMYGDWRTSTTSNTTVTVSVSGSADGGPAIDVQLNQALFAQGDIQSPNNYRWVQIAAEEQGIQLPANFVIGGYVVDQLP
jgi:hypothetical protein